MQGSCRWVREGSACHCEAEPHRRGGVYTAQVIMAFQFAATVPLPALVPKPPPPVGCPFPVQTYSADPKNVGIAGGTLSLVAQKEGTGYTSGRIRSKGSWYPGMPVGAGSV